MSLMRTLPLQTVKANSITLVKAAQILGIPAGLGPVQHGGREPGLVAAGAR